MKVFLDTNIIIDFYLRRGDFFQSAAVILDLANKHLIQVVCSSVTFVNAFFLLRNSYDKTELYNAMRGLAKICEISDVSGGMIEECLHAGWKDFEDSVQYRSAENAMCNVIVTRNEKDFVATTIPVMSPEFFLRSLYNLDKN